MQCTKDVEFLFLNPENERSLTRRTQNIFDEALKRGQINVRTVSTTGLSPREDTPLAAWKVRAAGWERENENAQTTRFRLPGLFSTMCSSQLKRSPRGIPLINK